MKQKFCQQKCEQIADVEQQFQVFNAKGKGYRPLNVTGVWFKWFEDYKFMQVPALHSRLQSKFGAEYCVGEGSESWGRGKGKAPNNQSVSLQSSV